MTSFQKEQFGKYLLLNKIGAGGMAEVYTGKMSGDEGFEKLLVIKKILPHLTDEEDLVKSFIDEAKLAALLQHENIIHIYDFGKIDDSYFIAMEHLFGKDLKQVIKKSKETGAQVDLENVLYIISRICDGLNYAHKLKNLQGEALNIIHRDISPQNIFITYDGHIKIIDFGIAKTARQSTLTQIGFVKGKLAYMSPEQAGNEAIDSRSDIFAVGIILYEMVTGRRMFEGETSEIYPRVLEADFEPPENIVPGLPPKLIEILYKSLEKDPDNRYQSCNEMLSGIEDCLDSLSLRPNARKMSRIMSILFEKELNGEKNHIVEGIKHSESSKSDAVIPVQTSNEKPEKADVLNTNKENTILGNQADFDDEKEGTVKYSPDEKPPQYRVKARKNGWLKLLIILLCAAGILGAIEYVFKYKNNNVTQSVKVMDEAEPGKAEPGIAEPDNSEDINRFLILAGESMAASLLTTPSDTSAYYYYNEVLKLDPENVLAKQGLKEIADRYALLAKEQIKQFNSEKALQHIEKGLMVFPDHPGLLSLREGEASRRENIDKFLILAGESMTASMLTTPADTSAYYYYNEVLKLDPENILAKQGLKGIADRYALLAEGQIKQFNSEEALQYIEKGLTVFPDHPGLLSLKESETGKIDNIDKFLALAKESLAAYKLTTPPDTSAYYYFNEVLKLDPENIPAKLGIEEIADRYALLAEKQIEQFKYEKALQYIEKGLTVSPGHTKLLSLKKGATPNLPKKVINRIKDIFD